MPPLQKEGGDIWKTKTKPSINNLLSTAHTEQSDEPASAISRLPQVTSKGESQCVFQGLFSHRRQNQLTLDILNV